MQKNRPVSLWFALLLSVLLPMSLSGCGRNDADGKPADPAESAGPVRPTGTDGTSGAGAVPERQDGERFDGVIIIEGMEETVRYEHARNDDIGFGMDWDRERFERRSGTDRECFVSVWDDPDAPENYLEVTYNPRDAETVADSVSRLLSQTYDIGRNDSFTLERAGNCIRIDASAEKGGMRMPDQLQMVYIIPAADGCRVATAHYSIEGAEGFGRRFRCFMDTFSVLDSQGEKRISDEQAVSAVRRYCILSDPELETAAGAGEYPVYWDIASAGVDEIVIVFRSYTGSLDRFYIDPVSGDTYVTEFVPGITDGEQQTDESLNVWDYIF